MDEKRSSQETNIAGDANVVGDGSTSQLIKAEDSSTIRDVIQAVVSGQVTGDVHIGAKVYTRSDLEELDGYLAHAVAAFEARMYQLIVRPHGPPDQPYKFLYAFEIEDADIFFGRDAASQALHQTVLKDRLTVLHAKSGAGKTSLLNAGLSPRLIQEGRLPAYARAYDDPIRAIKRAIAPPSLGPWPELLPQLTLQEFLGLACAHLRRQAQELVIILDQFEEFFIFWPERDHRLPLIDALADCYDDKSLPIRFVLALRKDYYSDLATFQGRLPHIFYNEFYLESVTLQEAQAAITGPVAELGYPVSYEPALLDVLLDDLARGGMELPPLQIICTELYEALVEGETTITLSSYEELGRAEGLLSGYLNSVLARLPGRGGAIAREVLKELVSSEATKRVLSYKVLVTRIETEKDELDDVLARLVNARLLRRDEVAGEIAYEMAHEYLIQEIIKWIDQSELTLKQAEELLAREVANWRVHGTLIPRQRLELLHPQRERLTGLDDKTKKCLLSSALNANFAVEDWARLCDEGGEKLLLEALNDPDKEIRLAAKRGLGAIWGLPELIMLGNEDDDDWDEAITALENLGDPRAVRALLVTLADDDYGYWYERVTEALGVICNSNSVEALIFGLRYNDGCVRLAAAKLLGVVGDHRAAQPLINALQDDLGDVREAAAFALAMLGDAHAVKALTAILRDGTSDAREEAAEALGELGDPRAIESLIAALHDKRSYVRRAAAGALGNFGDSYAVKPLIGTSQDPDEDVRRAVAEALGMLGDPRALQVLETALQDPAKDYWGQHHVQKAAAEALRKIGTPEALAMVDEWRRSQKKTK
jgi:HEAT repeat protein